MDTLAVTTAIERIAAKLQVPAGMLWEVLPRMGYVLQVRVCVEAAVLVICAAFLRLVYKSADQAHDHGQGFLVLRSLIWTIIGLTAMMLVIDSTDLLFWLHDPEAWAVRSLLDVLR